MYALQLFVRFGSGLGLCHACVFSFCALLRQNENRSAMLDNIAEQHAGLSWQMRCRTPEERQSVLHASLCTFRVEPAHVRDAIVCYMDLETDSLDCLCGTIVEIAGLIEDSGSVFPPL